MKPLSARYVHDLADLVAPDLLYRIGKLRPKLVKKLVKLGRNNVTVVLTGERKQHIMERHPEMEALLPRLKIAITHPDEAHKNARDPLKAILYKRQDQTHYLRVVIDLQRYSGVLKHSVFSYRLAKADEVRKGEKEGRKLWPT